MIRELPRLLAEQFESEIALRRKWWVSGGRTWWAHIEFTRINIAPTILPKKIEDVREAGASLSIARVHQCHAERKGAPPPGLPSDGATFISMRSLSCAPASSVPAGWRLGRAGAPGPSDT